MRRFVSWVCAVLSISLLLAGLTGCGGSATGTSALPTPAKVTLTPANSSLDLGATLQFNALVLSAAGGQITSVPVVYTSSNPSVLTFVPSAGGLACAGQWDTLGRVCTPKGAGVTQVTAAANGVVSPPVIVYVHQHVDTIRLSLYNPPNPPLPDCITLAKAPGIQNYIDLQASAFSNGMDVTNTVGSFSFSQTNPTVTQVNTSEAALNNNNGNQILRARFTASAPGITQIFASVAGVTSQPVSFETCLVQSINLQVGDAPTNTSFAVTSNVTSGISITPTVIDRLGNNLTNPIPTLTWVSSSPPNATVTGVTGTGSTAGTGTVKTIVPGGVSITAVCAPPNCNVGVEPPQPVYSTTLANNTYVGVPITGLITGAPVTSKNVYVTTTQCDTAAGAPINGCQPLLFPIAIKTNAAGASITLPSSPNSFLFSPKGDKAFLGSAGGLMIFNPSASAGSTAISQVSSVRGKVLAVSLDGDKIIVSDTLSIPNQVYVVSGLSGTGNANSTPLLITNATTAAFSPDGIKAFIVSNPTPSNPGVQPTLYVYSTVLAIKSFPLAAPAAAVSFYANSSLAYLAGGAANAVTVRNACDTTYAQAASFPGRNPVLFQALADGIHAVGVESPGVDLFAMQVAAPAISTTCPFGVSGATSSFVNLGQGTFTPLKMLVASDNSRAYILATNLGSVFALDLGVNTVSPIPLTGNPVPLDAALTPDGASIYVGSSDGSVHVLSTISNNDLQQVTFVNNNSSNKSSLCSNIPQTCNPDLIAAQP